MFYWIRISIVGILSASFVGAPPTIDREAVVQRHNVHILEIDTLNAITLGNGRFAMTMDITGLQTFPEHYQQGTPLGTLSEWG